MVVSKKPENNCLRRGDAGSSGSWRQNQSQRLHGGASRPSQAPHRKQIARNGVFEEQLLRRDAAGGVDVKSLAGRSPLLQRRHDVLIEPALAV